MAVKTEGVHLVERLLSRPMLHGHAVGSDEDASAVLAVLAVDEDSFVRVGGKNGEELNNLLIGGRGESRNGNVDEMQAGGFGLPAFGVDDIGMFAAEVNNGADAQFFEFRERGEVWLRATIEAIVDFSGIGNADEVNFFAVRGLHRSWRLWFLGGRWRQREEREKKE